MLLPEAAWNSVVSAATEDRLFVRTTSSSTLRSRSVSLWGLPLRGWVVVSPWRLHLTITELTVDRGSPSRAEISRTVLLHRWHPMTVPRWKSLSSTLRPILKLMSVLAGIVAVPLIFITALTLTRGEAAKSPDHRGWQHYFQVCKHNPNSRWLTVARWHAVPSHLTLFLI